MEPRIFEKMEQWGFIIFLSIFLFPLSLFAKQNNGNLYYQSDFETTDRVQIVKGSYITAHYQLNYESGPPGAYDGDSGVEFYLKIKNENILIAGKTYSLKDANLDVMIAEWASPASYTKFKQDQLDGTLTILDYKKNQELRIHLKAWDHNAPITFKISSI